MYDKNQTCPTSIDDLVRASQGTLVELPPFIKGEPFIAKLKRPSLLSLIRKGKIPNSLITTANDLFTKETLDTSNDSALSNLFTVLDTICEACFVEPTYQELKSSGIELTDEQLMFVFNYTQRGVSALKGFHNQSKGTGHYPNEQAVSKNTKRTFKDRG